MSTPIIQLTFYIASTPEKVWQALTDPELTEKYWGGTRIESDWQVGSKVIYRRKGKVTDEHVLLACERPRHLSHTFHPVFGEFQKEVSSRVSFEIVPGNGLVRLTMMHDGFPNNSAVFRACNVGWPMILSSLKTMLETGTPLPDFESP